MPYVPSPVPDLACPECGASVRVIVKRRGWLEELDHPLPVSSACRAAMAAPSADL
jgi:hypothetical protein